MKWKDHLSAERISKTFDQLCAGSAIASGLVVAHNITVNDDGTDLYDETIAHYSGRVAEFVNKYESVTFEGVHASALEFIPKAAGAVLDVGCGSGRDAAWFAGNGWEVVAIDPAVALLEQAGRLHPSSSIQWISDRLPGLDKVIRLGIAFDVIFVSAVWMHIHPSNRGRAFRKLTSVLKPGGTLIITLREGDFDDGRTTYGTSVHELEELARHHCLSVKAVKQSADAFNRAGVAWTSVILQLPDDGTEALPLLRHVILNDNKSSTYKLALLRVVSKIAECSAGTAVHDSDGAVRIPLGLVALYWLRMYKPLLEADIPQMPKNSAGKGLAFDTPAFRSLSDVSPYDLRIGARFTGSSATSIRDALITVRDTIHKMPAHYITYPNSNRQVFETNLARASKTSDVCTLDAEFLRSFGEMKIPQAIWLSMCRFSSWIEPSLVSEWTRLMQQYLEKHNRICSYHQISSALKWLDPVRDTTMVRNIIESFVASGGIVHCVWTGKRLSLDTTDVDHCFPFAAWPCNDLWNLMPTDRRINQHQKKEKLVSASLLTAAEERILTWWQKAYLDTTTIASRFHQEATAALPVERCSAPSADAVFQGLLQKRLALKRNLQVPEWSGAE